MTFIKGHKFGIRFEKGQKPWNKDIKGYMGANKTSFKKGMIPFNKGKKGLLKHTEEFKQNKRESFTGKNNPRWTGRIPKCIDCGVKIASRSFEVKRCIKCAAKLRTKENNCNWKGGITKLVEQIRKCFRYRQWRSDIWTRDNFTCQKCEKRGGKICAHHSKSFAEILWENKIKTLEEALDCEELWNINNGQTLCCECHKKTSNYLKNICK